MNDNTVDLPMTKDEAIRYIEQSGIRTAASARPGDNPVKTRALLDAWDVPLSDMRFIHVCGSNGKGSVCAMLDAILRAAGYRVGLFTSPHVQDFCERIRVDGRMIDGDALGDLCERSAPSIDALDRPAGYFCLITALAIRYFAEERCDIVILEAGIGGTYDATNAIPDKELAIVTTIGPEHTELLGDDPAQIARDKAGIITAGCDCVSFCNDPAVNDVLRSVCAEKDVPLSFTDIKAAGVESVSLSPPRQIMRYGDLYELGLLGDFQAGNAALAIEAVRALRRRGLSVPDTAVRDGLASVHWPARLEVLSADPVVILDGGHNPQCAAALSQALISLFGNKRILLMTGMMRDKHVSETLSCLLPQIDRAFCVAPDDERALPAQEMAQTIRALGRPAQAYSRVGDAYGDAVKAASTEQMPLIIFGSLYLAGEIRDLLCLSP